VIRMLVRRQVPKGKVFVSSQEARSIRREPMMPRQYLYGNTRIIIIRVLR
jgi:hypothetical protein